MLRLNLWLKVLAVASIFFTSAFCYAENFTLKPLRNDQNVHQLLSKNNKPTVVMIFQPDCSWCKKQGEVLSQFKTEFGQSINFSLVGTKGRAQQLKRELKHYDKSLPAYLANKRFLRKIGGFEASPTLLIFDQSGALLGKRRGFIESGRLKSVVKRLVSLALIPRPLGRIN